jgi:hypothetical protein
MSSGVLCITPQILNGNDWFVNPSGGLNTCPIEPIEQGRELHRRQFRPQLPVFDESGSPQHVDGCTGLPGLYFIGLHWLSIRSSRFANVGPTPATNLPRHRGTF